MEHVLVDVSTVCVVNTLPGCLRSAGNPKERGRGSPEYLDGDRLDGEAGSGCCGYWSHWKGPGGRRRREAHSGPWGGAGGGNRHQTCNIPDSPPLKCTLGAQIVYLKKKSTQHSTKWRIKATFKCCYVVMATGNKSPAIVCCQSTTPEWRS